MAKPRVLYHVTKDGNIQVHEIQGETEDGYTVKVIDRDPDVPDTFDMIVGVDWYKVGGPHYFLTLEEAEGMSARFKRGEKPATPRTLEELHHLLRPAIEDAISREYQDAGTDASDDDPTTIILNFADASFALTLEQIDTDTDDDEEEDADDDD